MEKERKIPVQIYLSMLLLLFCIVRFVLEFFTKSDSLSILTLAMSAYFAYNAIDDLYWYFRKKKNRKALFQSFESQTDERTEFIRNKANQASIKVGSFALLFVGLLFHNTTPALALVVAIAFAFFALVRLAFLWYYSRMY